MSGMAHREPRWLVRRKADAAAVAVRSAAMPLDQACLCYGVTLDQFAARQRAAERLDRRSTFSAERFRLFGALGRLRR